MYWNTFEFESASFLWFLLLVPALAFWYYKTNFKNQADFAIFSSKGFAPKRSFIEKLHPLLYVLRLLAVVFLIIALARPRNVMISRHTKTNKGIDIVMAIDVSGSMLARDLKPDRLSALKKVATDFVRKRVNDRIGIVVYAGESFTKTPVTSDKRIVGRSIRDIQFGQMEDGTAIGMGLGAAVNRLKDSKSKSKVIILLTDGVNNSGFVDPKTAAELAKGLGIKVYTIGMGTNGLAPMPYAKDPYTGKLLFRNQRVEIDEKLLKYIAEETSGYYFRATDNNKLKAIYNEINKLEKTEIQEFKYYNYQEKYRLFALLAMFFLFAEFLLKSTIFKSFI